MNYLESIRQILRGDILSALDGEQHGLTSPQLWARLRLPWLVYEPVLAELHDERLIIVTRDSSAGHRHSSQWGGIVQVQIRPKNL